jgi:hypothetical protein
MLDLDQDPSTRWISQVSDETKSTRFTVMHKGAAFMKKDRPAVLVTSTSWTEDEDLQILLDACTLLDEITTLPSVLLIITGTILSRIVIYNI